MERRPDRPTVVSFLAVRCCAEVLCLIASSILLITAHTQNIILPSFRVGNLVNQEEFDVVYISSVKRPLSDCPPSPGKKNPPSGAGRRNCVCPTQWCYSVSNTSVFFKTSIDIKNKKNYWKVNLDLALFFIFY